MRTKRRSLTAAAIADAVDQLFVSTRGAEAARLRLIDQEGNPIEEGKAYAELSRYLARHLMLKTLGFKTEKHS